MTNEFRPDALRPYNVRKVDEGTYALMRKCPFCPTISEVVVEAQGLWDYEHGVMLQNAFPDLSADEREVILTGICTPCYDSITDEDED